MANKTFLAFTAGIVVGILLAPDKGSTTRKKIISSTGDIADSIKTQVEDLTDQVRRTFSSAGDVADDLDSEAGTSLGRRGTM